jgi:hypothetical protein
MKREYDFSKGIRGAIDRSSPRKIRITIRLDNDVIEWFRSQVEAKGGGNYQTMINNALKEYINNPAQALRDALRDTIEEYLYNQRLSIPVKTAVTEEIRRDIPLKADSSVTTAEMTIH